VAGRKLPADAFPILPTSESVIRHATPEADQPPLKWLTGAELATMTPEEPDYVLYPYLARGLIVQLAGKVKGGKTTLAMHMVAAILRGRRFLEGP
jgi:hypothetical protein